MSHRLLLSLSLGLLIVAGSCGPMPPTEPPPRRSETRPVVRRPPPVRTGLRYVGGDKCPQGQIIELQRLHSAKGITHRKKLGCGRADLAGGKLPNAAFGKLAAAFTMLVTKTMRDRKQDNSQGPGGAVDHYGGSRTDKVPSYGYRFWGPTGKQFHKRDDSAKLTAVKIVQGRWLAYEIATRTAYGGFAIVDRTTGDSVGRSKALASALIFGKKRALYVIMVDGGFVLYCANLTTMREVKVFKLPYLKGDWRDSITWTARGEIKVSGQRGDVKQRYEKTFRCVASGARPELTTKRFPWWFTFTRQPSPIRASRAPSSD